MMECHLENLTVYYELHGEGRPMLMLHGRPLDHRHMVTEMEPLFEQRTGWKRIYLDLPGMGRTPGPDWITNEDQVLDVVLEVIDHLIPGERFVAAGLSYGGYLVRGLVYCRGAMMDGALLTVPAITGDHATWILPPHITLAQDKALMSELEPQERQSIEGMAVVQNRRVVERWRADIFPAVNAADHAFLDRLDQKRPFSFDADLDSVLFDKPTLLLTGRQDDVCGYQNAWDLLDNFPRATYAVLDRAGHCLTMEQEGLFRALVGEWLDRVEEDARA